MAHLLFPTVSTSLPFHASGNPYIPIFPCTKITAYALIHDICVYAVNTCIKKTRENTSKFSLLYYSILLSLCKNWKNFCAVSIFTTRTCVSKRMPPLEFQRLPAKTGKFSIRAMRFLENSLSVLLPLLPPPRCCDSIPRARDPGTVPKSGILGTLQKPREHLQLQRLRLFRRVPCKLFRRVICRTP